MNFHSVDFGLVKRVKLRTLVSFGPPAVQLPFQMKKILVHLLIQKPQILIQELSQLFLFVDGQVDLF